jgi:hypothetical protein
MVGRKQLPFKRQMAAVHAIASATMSTHWNNETMKRHGRAEAIAIQAANGCGARNCFGHHEHAVK